MTTDGGGTSLPRGRLAGHDPLLHRPRRVAEGLLDVLALEFRPLREDLLHGHAGAQVAQDGGHGHPEPSDAGLPEAFLGIEGNAVKEEVTDLHGTPARRRRRHYTGPARGTEGEAGKGSDSFWPAHQSDAKRSPSQSATRVRLKRPRMRPVPLP